MLNPRRPEKPLWAETLADIAGMVCMVVLLWIAMQFVPGVETIILAFKESW